MAVRVAAMDVRMAAAVADGSLNVAVFCRERGISRQTFYKWRRRFAVEGVDGLVERSRRPGASPGRTPPEVEDAVVLLRKQLADGGSDHGPQSIRWALLGDPAWRGSAPSRATIARILAGRGLSAAQPRKRPRSSMRRFAYARPNECWQSDWTEWVLADGTRCAIAATLDDHSRYLGGLRAGPGDGDGQLVWAVMLQAIAALGIPQRSLTDNGLCYSGARRGWLVPFEANLRALGVQPIASSPYHPQTCGKIERLWQTLKTWLRAHGPHHGIDDLNTDLAAFADYYNHRRPHRAHHGATPAAALAATAPARPHQRPLPAPTRHHRAVVTAGGVAEMTRTLRLGMGKHRAGQTIDALQDGTLLAVFHGNQLIAAIDIDPTRDYQPIHRRPQSLSAMS